MNHSAPSSSNQTCKIIEVPTKKYDGGSTSSSISPHNKKRDVERHTFDAFSYYSSHEILMNRLLYKEGGPVTVYNVETNNDLHAHNTETQASEGKNSNPRKTRLSFEVHPSMLFDEDVFNDLLQEAYGQ